MRSLQHDTLVNVFERQAERSPDASAIVANDCVLTYGQLNAAANRWARHLVSNGVELGATVGVCCARTSAWPIVILAILKAGAAYVPLDPRYPTMHLRTCLKTALPKVLVHDQAAPVDILGEIPRAVSYAPDVTAGFDDANLRINIPGSAAAYIIFTSGTTGQPNGVTVSHEALATYVDALRLALSLNERISYLHTASFAFSSSVRQLFVPLVAGDEVVLVGSQLSRLAALEELSRPVNHPLVLDLTPSLYQALLSGGAGEHLSCELRLVLAASERLSREGAARLLRLASSRARVFNMYGQTETAGIVSAGELLQPLAQKPPSIGRPLQNVRIYVLDDLLRPAPVGSIGELYVSGARLASGYVDSPGLTAERFVPSPFVAGDRLYRTGDLGRWLRDGTLEHIGRRDQQIKLRGFRIELAEIDAALLMHESVTQAVVLLTGGDAEDQMIAAYVVCGTPEVPENLRAFLQQRLPDYMIPSVFVKVDEMPLTPNGKLDREALPAPELNQPRRAPLVAPRTETEKKVAAIWAEVMQLESVGVDDDFFELGGHSLLAVALVSAISSRHGWTLPLPTLINRPTIAGIAEYVDSSLQKEAAEEGAE